jgi:hypothetical protein
MAVAPAAAAMPRGRANEPRASAPGSAGPPGVGVGVRQTEGADMAIGRRNVARLGKEVRPGDKARKVSIARADAHAAKLAPTIRKLQAGGVTTLRAIAAALNKRNIPTASGRGEWHPVQVWRVLARP